MGYVCEVEVSGRLQVAVAPTFRWSRFADARGDTKLLQVQRFPRLLTPRIQGPRRCRAWRDAIAG